MNIKKSLLAFGLAATAAILTTACSDDSSSGPEEQTTVVGDDPAATPSDSTGTPSGTPTDTSNTTIDTTAVSDNGNEGNNTPITNVPGTFSYAPVTEGATASAQKLYNFLATNFGSRTVSGVQTGDVNTATVKEMIDVKAVYEAAGKYPALVGFDFLFANGVNAGDAWYKSYTKMAVEAAADLWKQGGIPAFSWHWKDPSHAIDAFYTKKGNASEFTTFDYAAGFKAGTTEWDETSEAYQQIVADIDEISEYFLQLQEQGVAAIFRPLHESGGAWFWWSATDKMHQGAEYAALYRLVYDRMVKVNGVKNLVWVWNAEKTIFSDATWDPGSAYYDVFSVDIYNKSYDYQSNAAVFNNMKTIHGDKVLALSENGPIPDASLMHADNAVWSWNMPWYESWDGKYVSKTKNTVWAANLADPCVFALEDMPGWDNYTISNAPAAACVVGYALADLDTAVEKAPLVLPEDIATNGYLQVVMTASSPEDTVRGNVVLHGGSVVDLSKATKLTFNVDNSNNGDGLWFTIAFMDSKWKWAQPDGCWINGGAKEACEIDLATTAANQTVLEGEELTAYLADVSTILLEISTPGVNGTIFYDDVVADDGTALSDFNKPATVEVQEGQFMDATIIGGAQ